MWRTGDGCGCGPAPDVTSPRCGATSPTWLACRSRPGPSSTARRASDAETFYDMWIGASMIAKTHGGAGQLDRAMTGAPASAGT
ncbi:hypothetical protein ACFQ51_45815 [Streptomyces kaempferi]